MDLSIVIVNWNGLAVLRNCLDSIFGASHGLEFEVIVVDNASTDGSPEMVAAEFPVVRMIRNDWNAGFACANNIGISAARGENLLLLNSDTLVLDGAIDRSLAYLDKDPRCGVVGCRVLYPDGAFQSSYYRVHGLADIFMTRFLPFDLVRGNRLNRSRYWGKVFTQPTAVEVVAGCFFLLRKEVISTAGMLDEDFFMYGEDEEWCFRIRRHGWSIVHLPAPQVVHIHGFSAKKAVKAMSLISRKSPLLVLEKTRGVFVAWAANILMGAGALFRSPAWMVSDMCKGRTVVIFWSLLRARLAVLRFHSIGMFRPVWRDRLPGEGIRR